MGIKGVIDKLLLATTGLGAAFLVVDYLRNRGVERKDYYGCPYCHCAHEMTQTEFAIHIAEKRRGA